MRSADGALPDFDDGYNLKAVNFFAPRPTPMYILDIFDIFDIFFIFDIFLFFKAYQSYVTASLYALVLFNDSLCFCSFTSANSAPISSKNRYWWALVLQTPCVSSAYFVYSLYFAYFNNCSRQVQEGLQGNKENVSDWYFFHYIFFIFCFV